MKTGLMLCVLLLAGTSPACKREDPQLAIDAQAAAARQASEQAAAAFDDAVAKENWSLAKAQGEVLLAEHPGSAAAERVAAQLDVVRAKADDARETLRAAGLWSYNVETVKGGKQLSAAIFARDELDTGGGGKQPVRLIFRDHPSWGRSSYLVLKAGDFDCYGGCRVKVRVDEGAVKSLPASRPRTDEAIAMFIEDERGLWRMLEGATLVSIEFPVKAGGTRTAVFEVAGLDRTKLPAWN